MDPFIGQITMFGGTFAPRGWAFCDGQLLAISSNEALFSILGTTYGGDGRTTFALPDLRSRAPMHAGHGPGLSTRILGQKGGQEDVTLTYNEMPSHAHYASISGNVYPSLQAGAGKTGSGANGGFIGDTNDFKAEDGGGNIAGLSTTNDLAVTVNNAGGNGSHNNMQPYLAINFIIALYGQYPSRS